MSKISAIYFTVLKNLRMISILKICYEYKIDMLKFGNNAILIHRNSIHLRRANAFASWKWVHLLQFILGKEASHIKFSCKMEQIAAKTQIKS